MEAIDCFHKWEDSQLGALKAKLMEDLKEEISLSDEKTKTEDYIVLPDSVDGKSIQWKYGTETRAFAILILGMGASCMLVVSSSQRKKEEEKKESG